MEFGILGKVKHVGRCTATGTLVLLPNCQKAVAEYFYFWSPQPSPIPNYMITTTIKYQVQVCFVGKWCFGKGFTSSVVTFFYHDELMTTCRPTVRAAYMSIPRCSWAACTCTNRVVHIFLDENWNWTLKNNYSRYPKKKQKKCTLQQWTT